MTDKNNSEFENHLNNFTETQWLETISRLLPEIHEVDQNAVQIWFRFYPLSLFRYLQKAEDKDAALHGFAMQGNYELKNQIDTSHNFLWGHRFWSAVKKAITERSSSFDAGQLDLANEIRTIGRAAAKETGQDSSLLLGITAVGLMTLVQTGLDAFNTANGDTQKVSGLLAKSPEAVLAGRRKEKKGGILGFLRTIDKEFQVTWDETQKGSKFDVILNEELASGAARDQSQNWLERDERCGEGVIPVECRSAACGTCWVGVVAGAEHLSDVARLERKQMKVFGYKQGDEAKPIMRLACQAQAEGSVSIVLPPWNGVFGKKIYGVERVELEPATSSAKKLRETIDEALTLTEEN
ncbi:MAG: 2Fe-2S iron-sulfur cluster-binding protein [Pyrinomonadaceae bacterium]